MVRRRESACDRLVQLRRVSGDWDDYYTALRIHHIFFVEFRRITVNFFMMGGVIIRM